MRGRRRGRNRPSPQDVRDPSTTAGAEVVGGGSVKLVTSAPPTRAEGDELPPGPSASDGSSQGEPVQVSGTFHSTLSDIASAHAELDDVLPPSGGQDADRPSRVEDTAPLSAGPPEVATPEAPLPASASAHGSADPAVEEVIEVIEEIEVIEVVEVVAEPISVPLASDAVEPDAGRVPQAASGYPLPRVLAVANQKGGVGKTTTSVNLGAALAELGFRVLVIDLDPQGNATTGLGIDARNFELSMYDVLMRDASLEDCVEPTSMKNLFVAPATIALAGAEIELVPAFSRELKLKRAIESVIDDFDYVLIDCPPSLGLITVNALAAASEVLVPIQCEYYALEGLSQLMRNVHLVASNLNPELDISTIVLTMYDARTKLSDQVATEVRQHFGAKVCRIVIPRTVRLSEAPSFGQPITAFDPASRGAVAYRELAKEVSGGTS